MTTSLSQHEAFFALKYGLPSPTVMATRRTPRIIWAGQSNAQGQVDSRTILTRWDGPHSDPLIRSYRRSIISGSDLTEAWNSMRARQYGVINAIGWPSADLVCCLDLVRRRNFAPEFIEFTHGATSLALDWNPVGGTSYTNLVSTYNTAISTHPAAPVTPEPVFIWIQGESDATSVVYANDYYTNLNIFFNQLRLDIPALTAMKIVIVKLHPDCALTGATPATCALIRSAQDTFVEENSLTSVSVEVSDLTLHDGVHYNQASQITLGRRISAVITQILGGA